MKKKFGDIFLPVVIESVCDRSRHDGSSGRRKSGLQLHQRSLGVLSAIGQRRRNCRYGQKSLDAGVDEAGVPEVPRSRHLGLPCCGNGEAGVFKSLKWLKWLTEA